jgi:hypothetical protein
MSAKAAATPVKTRLVAAVSEIMEEQPDSLNFQHSILCQVGLPRKRVPGDYFERRSGSAILSVQAGKYYDGKNMVQQPVPYGPKARLALGYIHSYAKWADTPIIPAGESAREFLNLIGLTSADGRTMKLVKQQMTALAACRFMLGYLDEAGTPHTINTQPVKHFQLWVHEESPGQRSFWPEQIELSTDYFNDLKKHAVPYDPRAFVALAHSALAQDVYLLLCYRLHSLNPRGIKITWQQWKEQFGQEYTGKRALQDFKDTFIPAVRAALTVYPEARVEQVNGGLLLRPSRPPVPLK